LIYGVYGGRSDGFQPGSLGVGIIDVIRNRFFFALPGGASHETGFCPHGGMLPIEKVLFDGLIFRFGSLFSVSYDEFKKASEADLAPTRISEGTIGEFFHNWDTLLFLFLLNLGFMFESSMMFTITDYAMKRSGKLHGWFFFSPAFSSNIH
jgi:homogentisate 1,2-dioxygenase